MYFLLSAYYEWQKTMTRIGLLTLGLYHTLHAVLDIYNAHQLPL